VDDPHRILRLHLTVAAIGGAVIALILAAIVSALCFDTPAGLAASSHWDLVRSAVTLGSAGTVALGSLSLAVLLAGAESLWRQRRRSRMFLRRLEPVGRKACATVIADTRPLAFCTGLRRPRVFVSIGTLELLDEPQLMAVLAHERHHQRRRDPLRLFAVRALSDALFFLPLLRRLAERYSALIEVAADDAAVRASGGDPAPLASALLEFDASAGSAVVGIDPARVDHLCGESTGWQLPLAVMAWSGLVLAGIIVAALRAAEASHELTLTMPLLAQHLCMLAVVLTPLLLGAAALLFMRNLFARR
jgi:Zn-dependent protease with chaperone function